MVKYSLNEGQQKDAEMIVRLRANERACALEQRLNEVDASADVHELDLTNCIFADPDKLSVLISKCTGLRYLRCVACSLRSSDLFRLIFDWLPNLVQVEFSLVARTGVDSEVREVLDLVPRIRESPVRNLRRAYVEVGGYENFKLLSLLVRLCPNLAELRVHLVHGVFWNALLECRDILRDYVVSQTFVFTSEVPASIQHELTVPIELTNCAAICANVSWDRRSDSWNCTRFIDLALFNQDGLTLPSQMIVFAVHEGNLTPEWIYRAAGKHVWSEVRQLCLVLYPAERHSAAYPTAGGNYRQSLRELLTAVQHIVELNVSSFHFRADNDFTAMLEEVRLPSLRALCAPPCGFCHRFALRRLALSCPNLEDLDVRFDRQGSLARCAACDGGFCTEPEEDMDGSHANGPFLRIKLVGLTLSDVPRLISMWFLEHCRAVTVRLADCLSSMFCDYERMGELLIDARPRHLVLKLHSLPLSENFFLSKLIHITSLQYLAILLADPMAEDVAEMCVSTLTTRLPDLRCLHVHYPSTSGGTEQRVTWMRQEGTAEGGGVVCDRPCFLCSTATFIGLIKPINRDFQTVL
ncbi:uncharacterized protein [Dermacentor albipictus]|uniref:uncharacterized protein n=1 Tax=Dermacentor albipictus TaxID=60249 RepID=UPI0031FC2BB4